MPLKIIFAGTSDFGIPCLEALLHSTHQMTAVYTQPDRPAGRGKKLKQSPIKTFALEHSLKIFQPEILKDRNASIQIKNLNADLMIVTAYGLIIPKEILDSFPFGCINVHASLLPRWRGASPIQQAILSGDTQSGVTIMQMNAGLDTGDILLQTAINIDPQDTAQTLHDKLAPLGASALMQTLEKLEAQALHPVKQDVSFSTYAKKIKKEDAEINWQKSAIEIERQVRAFNPYPVAYTTFNELLNDEIVRIWKAKAISKRISLLPGEIISDRKNNLEIATGDGTLQILELQRPGKNKISVKDFLNSLQKD